METPTRDIWCVIPVHNCTALADRVARECRRRLDRVLVVDDGSTDGDLSARLRNSDIDVLRHERRRGKGAALRTALRFVVERGGTHMITVDGDGQHDPADLARFLAGIRHDPKALIIGCRDFNTPHVPGSSRFGRGFSNFWVRLETGRALSDTQSGFRAYPIGLISRLRLSATHYDFEIEVLVRAIWARVKVREVPIRVVYLPAPERVSSFRPFVDNARLALMHARLIGRHLLPWPHTRLVTRGAPVSARSLLRHPGQTLNRLLRENSTPAGLAAAAGVGSFLAVLPLISAHTLAIIYASVRLHLNKVMAVAIQNIYVPPFTPFLCIQVGHFLLRGRWWTEFTRETLLDNIHHRLLEWLLGSLILAPVFAVLAAAVTFLLACSLQRRRQRREEV